MLPLEYKPKKAYELIRLGSENDGGYLIIGHAETINDFAADFEFVGHTIYRARKRKVPFSPLFQQQEAE